MREQCHVSYSEREAHGAHRGEHHATGSTANLREKGPVRDFLVNTSFQFDFYENTFGDSHGRKTSQLSSTFFQPAQSRRPPRLLLCH